MPRRVDSPGQRRQLLREIERLAQVAIFGTLSETYRTCGHAGCHRPGRGPSTVRTCKSATGASRARPRATTSPKRPSKPRGKAWPPGRNCSSVCGNWRVEQARQFAARPRGRRLMKRWLSMALAGLGVCLLLALGRPKVGSGADHHPCLAG
jgi:hypothetical protein